MTNNEAPRERKDLPERFCWDLSKIYASPEDWEKDFQRLDALLAEHKACRGRLGESPEAMKRGFETGDALSLCLETLYVYASHRSDENLADGVNSARLARIAARYAEIQGETAWFEPELLSIAPARFRDLMNAPELALYRRTLEQTERERPHTLSEKEERILGMSGDAFSTSHTVFSKLNDADLRFPKIKDSSGKEVEITHANYISFLESPDRRVRRDAFNALYGVYESFGNTFAAILEGTVKVGVLSAKLRNFPGARAAALFPDAIDESVYDGLIDAIHARLPLLHRYMSLRARKLGLQKLEMYDILNPLAPRPAASFSWDEAKRIVRDALGVFGQDYVRTLDRAFEERWIDVFECRGKRSGAYSGGCYGKPPFVLLNFTGSLDSVFTLAHELGHSMHTWHSNSSQPYHCAGYRIFAAEVASTTNELLLHHHLMKTSDDPSFQVGLLTHLLDMIRATVFRQTQFAEFERDIYAMKEGDEPLTADSLCAKYREINAAYYGPCVNDTPPIRWEWARIPHFHYDFYVYKYATGLSAAAKLSRDILDGKTEAYRRFLCAGDTKDPLDLLRDAGVDFSTPEPVEAAMELFRSALDDLEARLAPERP